MFKKTPPYLLGILLSFVSFLASGQGVPDTSLAAATKLLQTYVSIPSVSGHERRAGEFLRNYCQAQGLHIQELPSTDSSLQFAATLYPLAENRPTVWLHHHIDVVPAIDTAAWRVPPFSGRVIADTLWGRGALDDKGLGIMQLFGLLKLKAEIDTAELPLNIGLLCVANEEGNGRPDAREVLGRYGKHLNPIAAYGEGGSGVVGVLERKPHTPVYGVSVAEKTALWLKLELEVQSFGHGATPAPEHANKLMIKALGRLENRKLNLEFNRVNKRMFRRLGRAEGGIRGFVIRHMNWWIFRPLVKPLVIGDPLLESLTTSTITITKIENPPGPTNQISPTATAYLDCRLQPNQGSKAFLRRLRRILDEDRIQISIQNQSPEVRPSPTNHYYDALEKAIVQEMPQAVVVPMLFPATTDNSQFRKYDIPTYGLVPNLLNAELVRSVHSNNERLPIQELGRGIRIYLNLLKILQAESATRRERIPDMPPTLY